jgi:xanthine/uracil permease
VGKKLSPSDLARGLAADGLSAVLAGFLNSFPDTAFAGNVGLVGLTRVRSRWVVSTCCGLLVLLGILPKIGQVVANVPGPVIGGAATVMFAMVTAVGIQTLHKTSFDGNHNLLIVAVSLAAGLIPAVQPDFYEHFPRTSRSSSGPASHEPAGGLRPLAPLLPLPPRRSSRISRRRCG